MAFLPSDMITLREISATAIGTDHWQVGGNNAATRSRYVARTNTKDAVVDGPTRRVDRGL